jgi:hypothetical protein
MHRVLSRAFPGQKLMQMIAARWPKNTSINYLELIYMLFAVGMLLQNGFLSGSCRGGYRQRPEKGNFVDSTTSALMQYERHLNHLDAVPSRKLISP